MLQIVRKIYTNLETLVDYSHRSLLVETGRRALAEGRFDRSWRERNNTVWWSKTTHKSCSVS